MEEYTEYTRENNRESKRIRRNEKTEDITLTNIRRIENRVIEGEEISEFEVITTDWDRVIKEHEERLEQEVRERKERLDRKEDREKHWDAEK